MFAQDLLVYDFQGEPSQIHPNAVFGSTPERIAAWESLTPKEQQQAINELNVIIANSTNPPATDPGGQVTANVPLGFVDTLGIEFTVPSEQEVINGDIPLDNQLIVFDQFSSTAGTTEQLVSGDGFIDSVVCDYCDPTEDPPPSETPTPLPSPTPTPTPTQSPTPTPSPNVDEDVDGLDDLFENELADGFTPYYHVSSGEKVGTGFATFNNSVPETVAQSFPAVPPISHYRVTPLRFAIGSDGLQYGLIQLDYLTLWNRDDGLQINALCNTGLNVDLKLAGHAISDFLDGLETHELDNERSIILIAAQVSAPNTFNPNASAYKALKLFTAAHEGTYLDHSLVFTPDQAISIGNHIELWISRSKHATYPFNPNFFPLIPRYVISAAYSALYDYYVYGQIGYLKFLTYMYLMDLTFFTCVVESFHEQGGVFAAVPINVGEITAPINESSFILDPSLINKLNRVF